MKKLIIGLLVLLVIAAAGYIVYDMVSKKANNENVEQESKLKNYDLDKISKIILYRSVEVHGDPKRIVLEVNDKQDIEDILEQIDNAKSVGNVPDGIGFESNFMFEIIYNDSTKTTVIFLNNGNLAISKKDNQNNYIEYEISNANLEKELIEKYF